MLATTRPCACMKSTFAVLRSVVSTLLIQGSGAFLLSTVQHAPSVEQVCKLRGLLFLTRLLGGSVAEMHIGQWFNNNLSRLRAEIKQRGVTIVEEQVAISRKFLA